MHNIWSHLAEQIVREQRASTVQQATVKELSILHRRKTQTHMHHKYVACTTIIQDTYKQNVHKN